MLLAYVGAAGVSVVGVVVGSNTFVVVMGEANVIVLVVAWWGLSFGTLRATSFHVGAATLRAGVWLRVVGDVCWMERSGLRVGDWIRVG